MSEPQVFSFDIATAIRNIRPNDGFSVSGNSYTGIQWFGDISNKPTAEEIETECQRLLAEYNSLEYSRNRLRKYQKNGIVAEEMIIALWEKVMESDSTAADALQSIRTQIKTDNPKPS